MLPEAGDFIVELADHCIFRVLIDARFVLNVFGSGRIPQCGEGLVDVVVGWTKVGDHHGFRVASKGILQDSGEFGVAVWNVGALGVGETRDDVAEGRQRQIDLGGFFQTISSGSCLALAFRTC